MRPALTAEQIRSAEHSAGSRYHLPEILLMEHAAQAALRVLQERFGRLFPKTRGLLLVGTGNNGADALALARLAHHAGVRNVSVVRSGTLSEMGQEQWKRLQPLGMNEIPLSDLSSATGFDWYVDGLFGVGLSRDLDTALQEVVGAFDRAASSGWRLALDVPSGVCADSGRIRGRAIHADATICFGFYKRGLLTGSAADYTGNVILAPIGIPEACVPESVATFYFDGRDATAALPARLPTSHKGTFGHVGVVVGSPEKQGAAALVARGALRAGAGLVTVLGDDFSALRSQLPAEVMTEKLEGDWDRFDRLVIGPGLGGPQAAQLLLRALGSKAALVCDADALNLLAAGDAACLEALRLRPAPTVLTPHPKEAARLLKTEVADIQQDRFVAVRVIAERYRAATVLKGKGTLICAGEGPIYLTDSGDPSLAKGGTGDLLAGVLAAMAFSANDLRSGLALSVYLHGRAAELATQAFGHSFSTLASEVGDLVPHAIREVVEGR